MLNNKEIIGLTGSSGILGKSFYNYYKNHYRFVRYPHRIENNLKLLKWLKKNSKLSKFIHFAAISNKKKVLKNKKKALTINHYSTMNLMNLLNDNTRINYFFFISSSNVYKSSLKPLKESSKRKPNNFYGYTKFKTENFIKKK